MANMTTEDWAKWLNQQNGYETFLELLVDDPCEPIPYVSVNRAPFPSLQRLLLPSKKWEQAAAAVQRFYSSCLRRLSQLGFCDHRQRRGAGLRGHGPLCDGGGRGRVRPGLGHLRLPRRRLRLRRGGARRLLRPR